jgi:hypothetical protein
MNVEYIIYETPAETQEALKQIMDKEQWPLTFVMTEVARILPGTSQLHMQAFVSGRKVPDSLHAAVYRFLELYREETCQVKSQKRAIQENLLVLKRRAKSLSPTQIEALPENEVKAFCFALMGELVEGDLGLMRAKLKEQVKDFTRNK